MSYRNPKQFVDTQTAQHYRNLQNTMMGITEDYVREQKLKRAEEAKRVAEKIKENEEELRAQTEYQNEVGQAWNNAAGPRSYIFSKSTPKLQEYINYAGKLSTKPQLSQQEKIIYQNTSTLPDTIKRNLTNASVFAEGHRAKQAKAGEMGGYSLENEPDQLAWADSFLGDGSKGEMSFDVDLTKFGGAETKYSYKNPKTGGVYTITGSMLDKIANNPDLDVAVTIPDETTNMQNIANEFGKTIVDGKATDEIKDVYYVNRPRKSRVKKDGTIEYYIEPNEELFIQNVKNAVISKIDGLGDGVSPNKIALFNFFKRKFEQTDSFLPLDKKFTKEEEDEFNNELAVDYATYMSRVYFREGRDIVVEEIKPAKKEEPTEGQIKREIAKETAKTTLSDMLNSPESYFKDKVIGGKKITNVRIVPSTISESGEKEGRTLEFEYEAGTSTQGGERTIYTDEMTFDLDDPVRVRALIDMLPEGATIKTALKKLVTGNLPIANKS